MAKSQPVVQRAAVCGAGGFIGGHLVERLSNEGFWVRGVDVKKPEFRASVADEFVLADLREPDECSRVLEGENFDQVYQLAADMGGMEFIHSAETDVLRNNVLINVNMIHAASEKRIPRYFYSSSVCVYRDMVAGEPELTEDDAYPAQPDNEYGWEKLYSERVVRTYAKRFGIQARIARFQNCYGPFGTWTGGREKAPAAICRKVAEAADGGTIDVFGDGTAIRLFIYVSDLVEGIRTLMESDCQEPANIGSREYVSVDELVAVVTAASGKDIRVRHVDGPVGVQSRNFSNTRIESLGFEPQVGLREGIAMTYPWIEEQVRVHADGIEVTS
jgi:GDP-D-mannose 3', 5'-epimerase